ncbi:MAG: hypothetical protein ACREGI_00495 [Candidatus Levyibacteriota bacterium]
MHKTFCASGFLFHLPSQQILLQQHLPSPSYHGSSWFLFGGKHTEKDQPEEIFQKIVEDLLDIKVSAVQPIYSYVHEETGENHVIVYAKLKKMQNFPAKKGVQFAWFSFRDVLKLQVDEQTKHDIVVGQRVIEAAGRKSRGEHTL